MPGDSTGKLFQQLGKQIQAYCWETRVPSCCVITACTDADITVVNLRCTQTMRRFSIFQLLVLLPLHTRQHLQFRSTHAAWLVVPPVIFL